MEMSPESGKRLYFVHYQARLHTAQLYNQFSLQSPRNLKPLFQISSILNRMMHTEYRSFSPPHRPSDGGQIYFFLYHIRSQNQQRNHLEQLSIHHVSLKSCNSLFLKQLTTLQPQRHHPCEISHYALLFLSYCFLNQEIISTKAKEVRDIVGMVM